MVQGATLWRRRPHALEEQIIFNFLSGHEAQRIHDTIVKQRHTT